MKKQTTTIVIASIFAVTSTFAAAATNISDQGYHPSIDEGYVELHNFDTDQDYQPSDR